MRVPGPPFGVVATHERDFAFVSVARAVRGAPDPVLGTLSPPGSAGLQATGAIETASSANGHYVFVSLEDGDGGGVIAVYRIGSTSAPRLGPGDYVGAIRLGEAVVGSALSPDGRYLYVTSEFERPSLASPSRFDPAKTLTRVIAAQFPSPGSLSVISVAAAERDPARAVLATVPAGLQPVRVAASPDGSVVWVTARASDRLLAFSATRLLTDPARAMLADVRVGSEPVGVALAGNGRLVVVADSNRFGATAAHAAITILSARAALAGRRAIVVTVRAGLFPREVAVGRGGVAFVTNFASDQLEAINLAGLRWRAEPLR